MLITMLSVLPNASATAYEIPEMPECDGAHLVIPSDMWVVGDGCHSSGHIQDSQLVYVPVEGRHVVKGIVHRGNIDQCQTNEDFFLEIGGEYGPETEDDADPCAISYRVDDLGEFDFFQGDNEVIMHTASECPPDTHANSVDVDYLCIYYFGNYCGNSVVEEGEECDDGNQDDFDQCRNDCTFRLAEMPVSSCTGEGELYLYKGYPFQEVDASFEVERDQVLIFTKGDPTLTVQVDSVDVTPTLEVEESSIKIYSVSTSPGSVVSVQGDPSDEWGARRVQGYLAQDSSSPVFDLSTLELIYDDTHTDTAYLYPGTYNYLYFDKYSINSPGQDQDNRVFSIIVEGPGGTVVNKTFTQPVPVPTEGVVTGTFDVGPDEFGYYTFSIDTEDSIYWVVSACPEPSCGDGLINQVSEECEPPYDFLNWDNNLYCPQSTEECSEDTRMKGIRDGYGDCNYSCECAWDPFEYECVEGECGAECDEGSDFRVEGSICIFDCSYEETCLYQDACRLEPYCSENIYHYDAECTGDGCMFESLDCDSLDYYDEYEYYCNGDDVRRHRLFHDFSCTENGCDETDHYYTDDELVETCDQDGWFNYGNEEGPNDPECENRDYTCMADGEAACGYSVTESHDYDDQDGSYCAESGESVETRDYYCDSQGSAQYESTEPQDCGPEAWSGGGDIEGFGDDPACIYTDYFCVDEGVHDFCTSETLYNDDYDYMDTPECQPDTMWEADHDFYCEIEACDNQSPENGCSPGDEWYNPRCSKNCGSECEGDECCEDSYCYEEYQDACEGLMLVDWNGNMMFDSMIVEDYAQNFCSGIPGCACSDNPVDCSAEPEGIYCVMGACGAECDDSEDCGPSECSETFEDFCGAETHRLFEYDDDRELDSTLVEDSCENSCEEGCVCTECEPSCGEPEVNDYCVLGVCDAECEDNEDCQPFIDEDTCYYDTECQYSCECGWQSDEYCPLPGTVEENTCYYGVRDCVNGDGCTVDYCELDSHQYCDPEDGCTDLVCVDIAPITLFHDGTSEKAFEFPDGGASFIDGKLIVPMDLQVSAAFVDLTGESVPFTTDTIHDFVLVNDVSGSMDDNCHCADGSYSDNGYCSEIQGYPYSGDYSCKIEDMKDANVAFSNSVLSIGGNMLGLVSYSTNLDSFIDLTDDQSAIETEIGTYSASGFTCISCGIRKGIEIASQGENSGVIILMTDGNANRCFAGVECGEDAAKLEALSEAQRAWDDFGISIVTIGFGEDADEELLQDIAEISADGSGMYYYSEETDLEMIYQELATELTEVYPTDPYLDVGSDGDSEWSYPGEFMSTETADFMAELQSLLDCTCTGCETSDDSCVIDMEVVSQTSGIMIMDNLVIEGCVYQEPPSECHDNDQDGHDDIACGGDDPDDDDPDVYPGAPELCDNKDNDVDGNVDEDLARQCGQTDAGVCSFGTETCSAGEWTGCTAVFPVTEVCRDGLDNDCDGSTDEGCSSGGGGGGGSMCVPYWECSEWGECQPDGTRTRECPDTNECNSTYLMPEVTESCVYTGATDNSHTASDCIEEWTCEEWSECSEGQQARVCSDENSCGTLEEMPQVLQTCDDPGIATAGSEGGPFTGLFLEDMQDLARNYWWAIIIAAIILGGAGFFLWSRKK